MCVSNLDHARLSSQLVYRAPFLLGATLPAETLPLSSFVVNSVPAACVFTLLASGGALFCVVPVLGVPYGFPSPLSLSDFSLSFARWSSNVFPDVSGVGFTAGPGGGDSAGALLRWVIASAETLAAVHPLAGPRWALCRACY